jgi:hypothetical protein
MGFGIRVPGMRISTRGVRIGPRFASVGVSTRGRVSGSLGPRIARVSISQRGVRLGTGVGPVRVSAGQGGLRIGGGLGPVFGSVGKSGLSAGLGVGPVWVGSSFGSGRHTNSGETVVSSQRRMGMSTQYQRYRNDLARAGGRRRTQDEMSVAGINAVLAAVNYMTAPFQNFVVPEPTSFNRESLDLWAKEHATQMLIDSGQITQVPTEIPAQVTKDSMLQSVLKTLEEEGVNPPKHPSLRFGINEEREPTRAELMDWAFTKCRETTSVFAQVSRRRHFLDSISSLANDIEREFPTLMEMWESETRNFQSTVDDICSKNLSACDAERQRVLDETSDSRNLIDRESQRVEAEQQSVLEIVTSVHDLFLSGDPTITTLVLQVLMSDNEGSAAPIGLDDGDLLVIMTAPSAADAIWPESIDFNSHLSAAKKSKADISSDYYMFLLCHTVATAREAVVASPHINNVRVLVIDEKDEDKDFLSRRLTAILDVSRKDIENLPADGLSEKWAEQGMTVVNRWNKALQSQDERRILAEVGTFVGSPIQDVINFFLTVLSSLRIFEESFTSHIDTPTGKRPRIIDLTEPEVNTTDEVVITVSEDLDSMKTLDIDISTVSSPDFWVLCGLVADRWNQDDVDIEALKVAASEICSCLYKPGPNRHQ